MKIHEYQAEEIFEKPESPSPKDESRRLVAERARIAEEVGKR